MSHERTLLSSHLAHLRASGLTDATIAAARLYSITDPVEAGRLLHWTGEGPVPALALPNLDRAGDVSLTYLRPNQPRLRDGKPIKYESPRGESPRLYFSPLAPSAAWTDAAVPLLFTEGIKKALAVAQAGVASISAQGVTVWHDIATKRATGRWAVHPDFAGVPIEQRPIYICFDGGDTSENPPVIVAEARLARILLDVNAQVRLVRVPYARGGPKVGIDDYLATHPDPAAALAKLLIAAVPADPIARVKAARDVADSESLLLNIARDLSFVAAFTVADAATRGVLLKALRGAGISKAAMTEATGRLLALLRPRQSSTAHTNSSDRAAAHSGQVHMAGTPAFGTAPEDVAAGRSIHITVAAEHDVVDEAIAAFASDERNDDLYVRGRRLVRVTTSSPPRIENLPRPTLQERLARAATWTETTERGTEPAHPPKWAVEAVEARNHWEGIRRLEGIVESPVLRPDGTVLDAAGYDAQTGLLFVPNAPTLPVPENPSKADALAAAQKLLDVVRDFRFASDADRSGFLSAVLTPLARSATGAPAPLHDIEASRAGSGKGLLCDVVSMIVGGRPMLRRAVPDSDAEWRKAITSIALGGERIVLFDNLTDPLASGVFDNALTAVDWGDRLLGRNTDLRLPLSVTWFVTGNNIQLGGDTTRRTLRIRLVPREENPSERTEFKEPELLDWVTKNRQPLLQAALTVLRAYFAAGKPKVTLSGWGSYEKWSAIVRATIVWLGHTDPAATRRELAGRRDRDIPLLGALLAGWAALEDQPGTGQTAAGALEKLRAETDRHRVLRAALAEIAPKGEPLPSPRSLGRTLAHLEDRVLGGRRFVGRLDTTGVIVWRVVGPPETANPANPVSPDGNPAAGTAQNPPETPISGFAGFAGFDSDTPARARDDDLPHAHTRSYGEGEETEPCKPGKPGQGERRRTPRRAHGGGACGCLGDDSETPDLPNGPEDLGQASMDTERGWEP